MSADLLDRRFLTPEAKRAVLTEWSALRQSAQLSVGRGDDGFPDAEIIPTCDALNSFPGIVTLQSCAGHAADPGHLWIWLDEHLSGEFDRWGRVLARLPGIDRVARIYTEWGQEITSITFDGDTESAARSVLLFFEALVANASGSSQPDP